ncbi:MAG: histidine phosphatase family protein [Acidimicrobiales bacterium]|jgi:probable phosphoglycerate mutase
MPKTLATAVCFVRHGTTAATGRILSGRTPGLHLSDKGLDEATSVGDSFAKIAVSAVYSSPLERAKETASVIANRVGKPVSISSGLLECDFGDWTGEPLAKLRRLAEWKMAERWPSGFRFPDGESFLELESRVGETVRELCRAHPGEIVVAVSHADSIKAALVSALGLPLDHLHRLVIVPCSVSTVLYSAEGPAVVSMGSEAAPLGLTRLREVSR